MNRIYINVPDNLDTKEKIWEKIRTIKKLEKHKKLKNYQVLNLVLDYFLNTKHKDEISKLVDKEREKEVRNLKSEMEKNEAISDFLETSFDPVSNLGSAPFITKEDVDKLIPEKVNLSYRTRYILLKWYKVSGEILPVSKVIENWAEKIAKDLEFEVD